MFRNYFFINIILILIVSFLGLRFYKAIIYKKDSPVNITVIKAEPQKIMAAGEEKVINKESLKVITEKDLFRPSRTSSLLGVNSGMPLKNPPTLFGTVIVGNEKTALLKEDAGKTVKMYRVKESVSGYLIVDIQNDKVILEAGEQTIEVKLRGKKSANQPQLTTGAPNQSPQVRGTRRRVTPRAQRPPRTQTNVTTQIPTPAPPAAMSQPVPVPAPPVPVSVPVPDPDEEEVEESPDSIQQQ